MNSALSEELLVNVGCTEDLCCYFCFYGCGRYFYDLEMEGVIGELMYVDHVVLLSHRTQEYIFEVSFNSKNCS